MVDGLLRFLKGIDDGPESVEQDDAAFALAVLLIEVARSDDCVEISQQGIIHPVFSTRGWRSLSGRIGSA